MLRHREHNIYKQIIKIHIERKRNEWHGMAYTRETKERRKKNKIGENKIYIFSKKAQRKKLARNVLYITVNAIDQMPSAQFIWRNFLITLRNVRAVHRINNRMKKTTEHLKENRIKCDKKKSSGNIHRH